LNVLLGSVSSAAPEVSIDVLLRIADSGLIREKQKRIELLESVFSRSSEVQKKQRLRLREGMSDTPNGYLSAAYDLKLDALSLKSRAVQAMLVLDPQRGRVLFDDIPKVKLPILTCNENLGYDVSDFYETVNQVRRKSFSNEEKLHKDDLRFVQSHVAELVSPAQVSPVIRLISDSSDLSAGDLEVLTLSLSSALKKINADPRSFSVSMRNDGVANTFVNLMKTLNEKNVPTQELGKSFRSYVVRQFSSVQCADVATNLARRGSVKNYVDDLNKWFITPIGDEELQPDKVDGAPRSLQFWNSTDSQKLLMRAKSLRFGGQQVPLPMSERASPEWQQGFVQLLADLENWEGATERSQSEFFHEKCNLYDSLFDLAPNRHLRTTVLLSFANYLKNASIQQESRIEWLLHANDVRNKIRTLGGSERDSVLSVLRNSGNQALQLYAELDDLLFAGNTIR
ncbi:MAG TPA: hypothetical protein VMS31_20105, partial [Pyrinomonadaceae bacterium]|nr:hypothetical protein [Pyrinomonadaceae bacterium]